jgi:hypothetical protein
MIFKGKKLRGQGWPKRYERFKIIMIYKLLAGKFREGLEARQEKS